MKPKTFLCVESNGIAALKLNRPERLNALTFEVYAELRDYFHQLTTRKDIRVVTITGEGRGFCSGGDVDDIIGDLIKNDAPKVMDFARMTCDVILHMRKCPQPIVAAVNGVATGAGAVIALAADIRLASDQARFAFLFTKVGISGADMGATFLLPRVVGLGRATEILMTSDFVSAQDALAWGLVSRVFKQDDLEKETRIWAEKLAKGPANSLAVTKEMLNRELNISLEGALEAEALTQAMCMLHPDFKEAYESFKQKRAPKFK